MRTYLIPLVLVLSLFSSCGNGELEIGQPTIVIDSTPNPPDKASNCGVGELICRGRCTDITKNPNHCGGCGNKCTSGVCDDYYCEITRNNQSNNNNPNQTNQTNSNNQTTNNQKINSQATNNRTTTPKPTCDFELCGSQCVDTQTAPKHCGKCNHLCSTGRVCQGGSCKELGEIQGVFVATNAARKKGVDCGVYGMKPATTPLVLDPNLNEAAQAHAQDMSDHNFFDHTGSDGSHFSTRVFRTAFSGQPIGENIAGGGSDPANIVKRWIASDGHCRNLMNPSATKIGIGYTTGGEWGTLWVQVFGR